MNKAYPYAAHPKAQMHSADDVVVKYPNAPHVGLCDYDEPTWDSLNPSGAYHPFYKHQIWDGGQGRLRMNAASIELGIGKQIGDVARYANSNNLGTNEAPIGVGYFYRIGYSGAAWNSSWWNYADGIVVNTTYVDSVFMSKYSFVDDIEIYSGHLRGGQSFLSAHPYSSGWFNGFCYAPVLRVGIGNIVSFEYGSLRTSESLKLFNDKFIIDPTGVLTTEIDQEFYFSNGIKFNNITLINSYISGVFDTFSQGGVSEATGIIYDTSDGHNHLGGNWSEAEDAPSLWGPSIEDSSYYYALGHGTLSRFDKTGTYENWEPYKEIDVAFSTKTSHFDIEENKLMLINDAGYIFEPSGSTVVSAPRCHGAIFDGYPYIIRLTENFMDKYNLFNFLENIDKSKPIETHKIGKLIYFVFYHQDKTDNCILVYDGATLKEITNTPKFSDVYASTIWKGELIVLYKVPTGTKYALFGFNGEVSHFIGMIECSGRIERIEGNGAVLFVQYKDDYEWKIDSYGYNYNLQKINQVPLLTAKGEYSPMLVYGNLNKLWVQMGSYRRWINRNISSALNFDSFYGKLSLAAGSIKSTSSLDFSKVILVADYPELEHTSSKYIEDESFVNCPPRKEYIDSYPFNNKVSLTKNDIPCSIIYNDQLFLGHRGEIASYNYLNQKWIEDSHHDLFNQIPVRFLPTHTNLFCMVQDFSDPIPEPGFLPGQEINSRGTNHLPSIPSYWDAPQTKILMKSANSWINCSIFSDLYREKLLDAVVQDDSIYVISYCGTSGIVCYKHDVDNLENRESVGINGYLTLNRYNTVNPNNYKWVKNEYGDYVSTGDNQYLKIKGRDPSDFHRFYLYPHQNGPILIHHATEILPDFYGPSGVLPRYTNGTSEGGTTWIDFSNSKKYYYHTLSTYVLNKRVNETYLTTPYGYAKKEQPKDEHFFKTGMEMFKPISKIILEKVSTVLNESDDLYIGSKYRLTHLMNSKVTDLNFVGEISIGKNIYILIQSDKQTLSIYKLDNLDEYKLYSIKGEYIFVGDESAYVGDENTPINLRDNTDDHPWNWKRPNYGTRANYKNSLVAKLNIAKLLEVPEIKIIGDGDDLFLRKKETQEFRTFRRYSTMGSVNINNRGYVPLLCRTSDPYGRLFTLTIVFNEDGSIYLSGYAKKQQFSDFPMGRPHILRNNDKLFFVCLNLQETETLFKSYEDLKGDATLEKLFVGLNNLNLSTSEQLTPIYNYYGKKNLIVGEHKIRSNEILNMRAR